MLAFNDALPFTALHRLELRNAISLAIFRHLIEPADGAKAWSDVETDLQARRLAEFSVTWADVFIEAEAIAARETQLLGTRSLDVLHLALANWSGAVDFLSFDGRQTSLAQKLGLKVEP